MATKKRPSGAKRAASATKARASAKKTSKAKALTKAKARRGRAAPIDVIDEADIGAPKGTSTLVIVESPAKAKTIGKYLGKGYTVRASYGHVRDLPKSKLGVDVEQDFLPQYLIPRDKKDTVKTLKQDVKSADEILLATDPDREGEAIAWHLVAATGLEGTTKKVRRIVFHEITKEAIKEAVKH